MVIATHLTFYTTAAFSASPTARESTRAMQQSLISTEHTEKCYNKSLEKSYFWWPLKVIVQIDCPDKGAETQKALTELCSRFLFSKVSTN